MASSLPDYTKIPTPFANNGDRNTIPQQATNNGLASFAEGFPEITSLPLSDGGQPPTRADFNAIGYMSTNNIAYLQQGGIYTFDNTISQAIGGYPQGAILAYIKNGKLNFLISKINNNTYNFNTNSSYIGQYWDYAVNLQNYLPLTGGTLTGDLYFNKKYPTIKPTSNTDFLALNGGLEIATSGAIRLVGSSCTEDSCKDIPGSVQITASDGSKVKQTLLLAKDGFTLNDDPVITAGKPDFTSQVFIKTSMNENTIPSSNITYDGYKIKNAKGDSISALDAAHFTTGTIETRIVCARTVNGTRVFNTLQLQIDKDGNKRFFLNRNEFKDFVTESWNSDTMWYKVYKSGWVEQGGIATDMGENSEKTFTYSVPMLLVLSANASLGAIAYVSGDKDYSTVGIAVTTTTATISKGRGTGANWVFWEVKGYKA